MIIISTHVPVEADIINALGSWAVTEDGVDAGNARATHPLVDFRPTEGRLRIRSPVLRDVVDISTRSGGGHDLAAFGILVEVGADVVWNIGELGLPNEGRAA